MKTKLQRAQDKLVLLVGSSSELRIAIIIVAIGVVMSVSSSYFLRLDNIMDLFESISVLSILAFGMTFVLFVGELDMSVGSIMAMAAISTNVVLRALNMPVYVGMLAGIITGIVVGIINGTLVELLGFPSLITTLAVMSAFRGIVYVLTGDAPLNPYNSNAYFIIGNGIVGNSIPVTVIITIVFLIILAFIIFKTRYGRRIVMTGANRKAAAIAGVDTRKVVFVMFVMSGLMAAVAGMLLGSKLKSVFPEFGMDYELRAITAAVIGGVSLFGGKGSFVGTFLGAILIGLIFNIINLLGLDPYWQSIIIGLIVLIAVLSDKLIYDASARRRPVR